MRRALFLSISLALAFSGCVNVHHTRDVYVTPISEARVPITVNTGSKSLISTTRYHRVRNFDDWKQLWIEHNGNNDVDVRYILPLMVDFDRCEIIAIFAGKTFNSRGLYVDSITKLDGGELRIRFDEISYQTMSLAEPSTRPATSDDNDGVNRVTPFAFIVLPRSDKTIVLEEDVNPYLRPPPVWKEVAQLKVASSR